MTASKQPLTSETGSKGKQEPLIRVQNVKKYYKQKASFLEKTLARSKDKIVYAVDDVSFDIYPGETLGLVGESGCGKSTLGRTVIQLHEATEGKILYRNQDITKLGKENMRQYRQKNQIIFQNPYASLNPRKTVRDILQVALVNRGITRRSEQEDELLRLIGQVGLSRRHLDNYPHQFSGGQRQRIGIARALAMKPDFIVADEPVSALDVSVQAQIVNLLEELQQEYDLTFLFVAHDLSVVHYVSDRVAVMYLGQLIELAETTELFNNPQHPYTQALLSSIPVVDKKERRERIILQGSVSTPLEKPRGCLFQNRCMHRIGEICSQERPQWVEHNGHGVACHLIR
ncbi:ATP-binding cassette domain-containing protein [Paenibacillus thalictri]|uniref:ATP-binding cassette domain-containing protein n=1 Tax=Paenibacillus thalictri TaxID=2527873 RepID=A0A4Q9DN65_9BACL|nr:ATP-binding cassette domain-containing protein [Paenibacillus thalictri]